MAQTTETYGEWPLKRLMTEVVGSGHKSADDMTREQASEAFRRILDREPDRTTLGAFWLANRWKRNTPEELAAFLDVMREESVETAAPTADPVDCGANYDGKGRSAILGSLRASSPPRRAHPWSPTAATVSPPRSRTPTSTSSTRWASGPNSRPPSPPR